jgi:hypothetical protein
MTQQTVIVRQSIKTPIVLRAAMGPQGQIGPAGDVGRVVSRAAMAAIAAGAGATRMLVEEGREGLFVFTDADLSILVTADPLQGVFVAPALDPTGASGAWVRSFTGAIAPEWFGAVADGVTDDHPPLQGSIDLAVAFDGGTVHCRARKYLSSAALVWSGAPVTLEGEGASFQPGAGTILYFPNSATQTGCIRAQNGALGKGGGSQVRNLRILGNNAAAVSAANAKAGLGSGLLVQCPGAFTNVIAMQVEGNGIYAMSGYPAADVTINCNGAVFVNCTGFDCGNNGRATFGADSNTLKFFGGGGLNNAKFGDYVNGFLGSNFYAPTYEGNETGGLRFGDVTRDNKVYGIYCEDAVYLLQFDAGGSGNNFVEYGTLGGALTIDDGTVGPANEVKYQGVTRKARFGGDGADGTVNITSDGSLLIRQGKTLTLDDVAVSSHWDISNSGGNLLFFTNQNVTGAFYNSANLIFSWAAGGLNIAADRDLLIGGTVVPLRNLAAEKLLGRRQSGAGLAEAITLGSRLAMSATGTLNVADPAIQAVASAATVTPTFANDQVNITAQAAALNLANPTGTAVDGWGIAVRIKDNGTARAITYDAQYRAIGVTLPATTVAGKTLYLGMVFNAADTKWDVVAVAQEA